MITGDKDGDLISDGGVSEAINAQARLKLVRIGNRLVIVAVGLWADTNDRRIMRIEAGIIHHEHVHGGVKISVVNDVVDMPIDIVVIPTRLYGMEIFVIVPGLNRY